MKKITLLILTIAVLTAALGITCFADAPNSSYIMVLNDEFTGTTLNTDIWAYRIGNPYGGKNLQENVRVSDGKLYLDYRKVDGYYTGGGVLTLANLPYGYYETKAKVYTGANGFHTSFWTAAGNGAMSSKPAHQPQVGSLIEIDGFEFNSRQDETAPKPAYNLHYWWGNHVSTGGAYYECDTDGDATTSDWFTMGFEWLPGEIIFYCNGKEVGRISPQVYNPSSLWLTAVAMPENYLKTDGTFNIDDSKMDANGYFGSSEYEYFRYYNKPLKGVNLLGNGHFEFNRHEKIKYPRSFYVTGLVNPVATPLSNSGFYAMHMFKGSTMGQDLPYLASGKYTFEGYFQTKNANARLAVYDKAGTLLKALNIPEASEWTKVSLSDIQVNGSAYAVVEVTDGDVLADDLSFFCQEGESGHETYRDTDYESYGAFKSAESTATIIPASDAQLSSVSWGSSTITGMSNKYASATFSSYSKVSASLETVLKNDEKFELQLYRIFHPDNTATQNYTVTLDGVTIAEKISVSTRSGDTMSGDWIKLCDIDGKAGQTLKVTMSVPKIGLLSGNSGNARVTPIKLLGYDEKFADVAFIAQFSNPIFQFKNTPYAFDKSDITLSPYKNNDEIYIPYQALKNHITIPGVDASAKYVTATQINASGTYILKKDISNIIIYPKEYEPSENAIKKIKSSYSNYRNSFLYSSDKEAEFVGTSNVSYQELYDRDAAQYNLGWGSSSLGYGSKSYYSGNSGATASWEISAKHTNKYSVEFYSIVHAGGTAGSSPSTKSAGVDLSIAGKTYTFSLDQCNGTQGWYSLGEYDLLAGDSIFIDLFNAAGSGILRANAVRLVPVFETAAYAGKADKDGQEYYSHSIATKTGTWTDGTDVFDGCATSSDVAASVKWNVTAPESKLYRVQIYSPQFGTSATAGAKVSVATNDEAHYFLMNQNSTAASGAGWYELGMFDLTKGESIEVEATNFTQSGSLYAKAIRLIDAFEKPAFVNDIDALGQEYYGFASATTTGTWQPSTGVYTGCYTAPPSADNLDASVTWNITLQSNAQYSIQIYVPKYTSSGAKDATAELIINGEPYYYTLYQRADSATDTGNGWYELEVCDLDTSDTVSVKLTNRTHDGWLRAKAVRIVPVPENPAFVNNTNALYQEYYGPEAATKTGDWKYSSGEYAGCMYAQYVAGNENASINWKVYPQKSGDYSIQVFLPKYTAVATSKAAIDLSINGLSARYFADERANNETETGTGWYTLGTFNLKETDLVSVSLSNYAKEGWLRAKAIRLIPNDIQPVLIGDFDEQNQLFYDFSSASETEGAWRESSSGTTAGTRYGTGSVTWTVAPENTGKYSLQVYIPFLENTNTTTDGYINLTIDGSSHTFSFNQRKDPSLYQGWYDLGVFTLTPDSDVKIKMGKNSGTFLRIKAVRAVPFPNTVSVTKSGSTVAVNSGTLSNYAKTVIFTEYNSEGGLEATQILENKPALQITMQNPSDSYKIFFWKNIHTMIPFIPVIEGN